MSKACLILVGENRLFREGLKHTLASETITIGAQVSFLSEVLPILRSGGPDADLIVYDQSENAIEDLSALKEITQEFTGVGVMILADHVDQARLDLAIASGARGFLPKSISTAALRLSLELVLLGEGLFAAPALPARERPMIATPLAATEERSLRTPLSPRERAILGCLELGLPNKTIARNLDMAEATVKVHLKAVLRKINAGNRTQAAVWAMNHRASCAENPGWVQ
jgi:two-component system, NarL family, nitrate/nitrite response regulator NarL